MEELKLLDKKEEIEMQEPVREENETPLETERGHGSQGRRNPPARNTSRFWFERFLAVIQRQNPSVIDSSFLSQIAPSNEGKLLAQLKFLRVIDEQGRPTRLLPTLNMVGDEQKRGFEEIARTAYGELIEEVKVERAVPEDAVNFFIRRYAFTRDKAINAARFFLYLAEKGSMPVSSELASFLLEKDRSGSSSPALNGSSPGRISERPAKMNAARESYSSLRSVSHRRGDSREEYEPVISAVVNLKLDKDTPKEYWDRVLALLGEKRKVDVNLSSEQFESQSESN